MARGNDPMSDVLEYSYRVKAWKLVLMMTVCDAAAVGLGYIAFFNDAGIRFYRLVTLSPDGATILLWIIAAVCAVAGSFFAFMLASGITKKTFHIRLTPAEFTAPAGFMKKNTRTVPLSEIQDIRTISVNGQHQLTVLTPDGKMSVTHQDIGKPALDELSAALTERVAALRGG